MPVAPEEVVVTPGAKPIMFFTILALVDRGDEEKKKQKKQQKKNKQKK